MAAFATDLSRFRGCVSVWDGSLPLGERIVSLMLDDGRQSDRTPYTSDGQQLHGQLEATGSGSSTTASVASLAWPISTRWWSTSSSFRGLWMYKSKTGSQGVTNGLIVADEDIEDGFSWHSLVRGQVVCVLS